MIGFNRREKIVFRYSLFFHFFGACFLFAIGLLPSCEEDPEEIHVFELAMASDQPFVPQKPVQMPSPEPTPPQVQPKPKPKPIPQVPVREAVVKPKPTPTPKPAQVKPKPKPIPEPTPKPVEKPQSISFAEFQRKNKLPPVKQSQQVSKPLPVVKIDQSRIKPLVIEVSKSTSTSTTSVPASVLNAYLSSVKSKLERIWEQKLRSSSISNGGEVWLSFRISSNGSLISKKISKSSGNRQLDALVLEVASLVGNVGTPPGGKLDSDLKVPFRLN